jgi:cytochrome c peroxidase
MKVCGYILILALLFSCAEDDSNKLPEYVPTPLALDVPPLFQQKILPPVVPFSNPQTVEGVALGKNCFLIQFCLQTILSPVQVVMPQ